MPAITSLPDPQKARAYFENKVTFTTGPFELFLSSRSHGVNIVDVREAEDYEKGHIPGAINMPHRSWDDTSRLTRDKANVFYCYSQQCHLAANACAAFAAKGYPVMELEGGFSAWEAYELEVKAGDKMKAAA